MTDTDDVDVLIVGSGPAGSTYARVISEERPATRVLIVEVGPHLSDTPGEHVQNLDPDARTRAQQLAQGPRADCANDGTAVDTGNGVLFVPGSNASQPGLFTVAPRHDLPSNAAEGMPEASMSSGVGGMGVHWAASSPRFSGDERSSLVPSAELDAAYAVAERLLAVDTTPVVGSLVTALRDRVATEFDADEVAGSHVGFMPRAVQRNNGRTTFSGTAGILGHILETGDVTLRAQTLARRILLEGPTAVGAELEDRVTGRRYTVRARRVVICADSLRTPQLLHASGLQLRALGHYFNEHFQVFAPIAINEEFLGAAGVSGTEDGGVVRVSPTPDRPFQGQVVPLPSNVFGGDGPGGPMAVTMWYGSKDIQFEDAVEFRDDEVDFYGMPAMTIHYPLTDRDHRTLDALKATCARTATAVGTLLAEPQVAPYGGSLHYQGTVRLGAADDGASVCDPFLRVWGTRNLYVGGNGVIETASVANPTLTSVALAVRAARRLAAELAVTEEVCA